MQGDHRQKATAVACRFTASDRSGRRAILRPTAQWAALGLLIAAALLLGATSARAADPVIAAAGDIACDNQDASSMAGTGAATRCRQKYTSDLLVNAGLAKVLTLGDNQYDSASLAELNASVRPELGPREVDHPPGASATTSRAVRAATSTTSTASASSNGPAGPRGKGYYSFDVGSWHLIALNSNCSTRRLQRPGRRRNSGCAPISPPIRTPARSPTGTTRASAPGTTATTRSCSRSGRRSTTPTPTSRSSVTATTTSASRRRTRTATSTASRGIRAVRRRDGRRLLHRHQQRRSRTARCARTTPSAS